MILIINIGINHLFLISLFFDLQIINNIIFIGEPIKLKNAMMAVLCSFINNPNIETNSTISNITEDILGKFIFFILI